MDDKKRMNWGSRLSFILVSAGATIGFGNIWRFPYLVGQNGGGAFLLMFLACIALIGIPLLVTEMVIGRRMSTNAIDAFTVKIGQKTWWKSVGFLAALGAFGIMAYYCVLAGWVMAYTVFTATGQLPLDGSFTTANYKTFFDDFTQGQIWPLVFTFIFMLFNHFGQVGQFCQSLRSQKIAQTCAQSNKDY